MTVEQRDQSGKVIQQSVVTSTDGAPTKLIVAKPENLTVIVQAEHKDGLQQVSLGGSKECARTTTEGIGSIQESSLLVEGNAIPAKTTPTHISFTSDITPLTMCGADYNLVELALVAQATSVQGGVLRKSLTSNAQITIFERPKNVTATVCEERAVRFSVNCGGKPSSGLMIREDICINGAWKLGTCH